MKISISKSSIRGAVRAPSSKSYTIRALICAAMAEGKSEIRQPLGSEDTAACRGIFEKLGIRVEETDNSWIVHGGRFHRPEGDLFCNESAATQRFMTAVCSLVPGTCRLTAAPSLRKRPVEPMLRPLKQLGVECGFDTSTGTISVHGGTLKGGYAEMPGDISSQYVSALLFIAPLAREAVTIRLTTPLESKPYVMMTLAILKTFGIIIEPSADFQEFHAVPQRYTPATYTVEGDWSSASYLLAAGALAGEINVTNLSQESLQADRKIVALLTAMGASVDINGNSIQVWKSNLKSIHADLNECIDLLPTMGILAAAAEGTSVFSGIERARIKESNRVSSVKTGLEAMGIRVTEETDRISITGSPLKGAVIDSHNDHRIAMAFSLLGLLASDTVIEKAECVAKTYPEFWDILEHIGGEVKNNG